MEKEIINFFFVKFMKGVCVFQTPRLTLLMFHRPNEKIIVVVKRMLTGCVAQRFFSVNNDYIILGR